jgi:hypothetical protein
MRNSTNLTFSFPFKSLFIFVGLLIFFVNCTKKSDKMEEPLANVEDVNSEVVYWSVRAIYPDGNFLEIKAIDSYGNTYDIKAIQDADQRSLLDIKAFVKGEILPVKILANEDNLAPVKVIAGDGTLYGVKAINSNGDRLNVKGVKRDGNIIHIKAIDKNGSSYAVQAISPTGQLNDVKGVKTSNEDIEYQFLGHNIYAHVKALPQTGNIGNNFLWHIVSIHPDGYTLPVKAFDKDGNAFDVKAIQDADQRSLLNVKTFVGEMKQLPVKLLVSKDKYIPMNAIGEDGTLYEIKAITPEGEKLDIKGINRSGNIIHIKAINKDGEIYGVKAISPEGELNDVKGIKMFKEQVELILNNVEVYAHVKALPQAI